MTEFITVAGSIAIGFLICLMLVASAIGDGYCRVNSDMFCTYKDQTYRLEKVHK